MAISKPLGQSGEACSCAIVLCWGHARPCAEEHEVLHGGNVCFPAFLAVEDGAAEADGFDKDSEGLREGWGVR